MRREPSFYFATGGPNQAQFATNILNLRAAGCDIIVDDITFFAEGVFQDGTVAQAVNSVVASGALYFSAAGNEGRLDAGTSGTWEGDFVDSGIALGGGTTHNFGGGVTGNQITSDASAGTGFWLKWSDPLGGSGNDYDLYLLDSTMTTRNRRLHEHAERHPGPVRVRRLHSLPDELRTLERPAGDCPQNRRCDAGVEPRQLARPIRRGDDRLHASATMPAPTRSVWQP